MALVRVVHHYGSRPEFVLLGGLVPELLCSASPHLHAGTTDVDVQVDLEIAAGSVNTARLERALRNADFVCEGTAWRWRLDTAESRSIVKFELLADQDDAVNGAELRFVGCAELGAANLRGTGFAARDHEVRTLQSRVGGVLHSAEIQVAGLAGFLLAKCAAARSRRLAKDWYDLAFVLAHNDAGGPVAAADVVRRRFGGDLAALDSVLADLAANFEVPTAQGAEAYASQMALDHPELDGRMLRADGVANVTAFVEQLRGPRAAS